MLACGYFSIDICLKVPRLSQEPCEFQTENVSDSRNFRFSVSVSYLAKYFRMLSASFVFLCGSVHCSSYPRCNKSLHKRLFLLKVHEKNGNFCCAKKIPNKIMQNCFVCHKEEKENSERAWKLSLINRLFSVWFFVRKFIKFHEKKTILSSLSSSCFYVCI